MWYYTGIRQCVFVLDLFYVSACACRSLTPSSSVLAYIGCTYTCIDKDPEEQFISVNSRSVSWLSRQNEPLVEPSQGLGEIRCACSSTFVVDRRIDSYM